MEKACQALLSSSWQAFSGNRNLSLVEEMKVTGSDDELGLRDVGLIDYIALF